MELLVLSSNPDFETAGHAPQESESGRRGMRLNTIELEACKSGAFVECIHVPNDETSSLHSDPFGREHHHRLKDDRNHSNTPARTIVQTHSLQMFVDRYLVLICSSRSILEVPRCSNTVLTPTHKPHLSRFTGTSTTSAVGQQITASFVI